jgi:hypothetical protein
VVFVLFGIVHQAEFEVRLSYWLVGGFFIISAIMGFMKIQEMRT